MQGAGIQIQVLRFTLLIVLTIALASVAVRINSHSSSSASRHRSSSPVQPAGPGSSSPAPSQSNPPSPSVQPTHATRSPRTAGHTGGGSTPSGATGPQELPVTGWAPALKLGGLAFVLIGGGLLTVRAAGPRRPRQRLTVQD